MSWKHLADKQIFAVSIKRPLFSSLSDISKSLEEHGIFGNVFKIIMEKAKHEMDQFIKMKNNF